MQLSARRKWMMEDRRLLSMRSARPICDVQSLAGAAEIGSTEKSLKLKRDIAGGAAVEVAASRIVSEGSCIVGLVKAEGVSIGKIIVETSEGGEPSICG